MAVDGAHVYWANEGGDSIGRANLDGTATDQSFISGAFLPCGVAVDGAHVYWANLDGTIGRANLDGSGVDQSFIAITGPNAACGLAVDGAHIYWATRSDDRIDDSIGRANIDGTGTDQRLSPGRTTRAGWRSRHSALARRRRTRSAEPRSSL